MVALAEAAQDPDYPAEICLVLSNNPEAQGLQKAADMGIPIKAMDHRGMNRARFDELMDAELRKSGAELVCCAGYMRILSPEFVRKWEGRLLNIHPSLLPKYKGLNTHQRAIDAGDKEHGCSVHFVTEELDAGEVIGQSKVKIAPNETAETLSLKVQRLEHPLYVKSLNKVAKSLIATERITLYQ